MLIHIFLIVLSGFKASTTPRKYYFYSMMITGAIQEFKSNFISPA